MSPKPGTIEFPSGAAAKLSIIDPGLKVSGFPAVATVGPPVEGYDFLPMCTSWSFLIESPTGRKAIFDLAVSKNAEKITPGSWELINQLGLKVESPKGVSDVLAEHGFSLESVDSIIWRSVTD
jgi:hypothetical protein